MVFSGILPLSGGAAKPLSTLPGAPRGVEAGGSSSISYLNQSLFWGVNDRDISALNSTDITNLTETPTTVIRWPGGGLGDRWDYQAVGGRGYLWANNVSSGQKNYTPGYSMADLNQYLINLSAEHDPQKLIVTLPGEINNATQATDEVVYITKDLEIQPAYWEIGNEPGAWTHFNVPWPKWYLNVTSRVNATQYALVVHNYTTEILRVDPGARFIVWPGLGLGPTGNDVPWIEATLEENCAVAGAVAIHVYPNGPGYPGETLSTFYATLNNASGLDTRVPLDLAAIASTCPGVPLFVDELGSASGHTLGSYLGSFDNVPYIAAEIAQAMILNITNVDFFALQGGYNGSWFSPSGAVRPTFYLYADMFRSLPWAEAENLTAVSDPASGVWAVRTENASESAILVSNANPSVPLTINLSSLGFPASAPAEAITWNNTTTTPVATGFEPAGTLRSNWTLPGPSVAEFIVNATSPALGPHVRAPGHHDVPSTEDSRPIPAANQTWLNVTTGTHPSARDDYGFTYDTLDGYALLFGGINGTHVYGDTWTLSAGVWTNITSTVKGAPPARYGETLVYQKANDFVVMFGGRSATGTVLSDTWGYHAGQWFQLSPSTTPPARYNAQATYENATGYLVMFGGYSSTGTILSDTWEFKNSSTKWSKIVTSPSPEGLVGAFFGNVTASGYELLYGGFNATNGYSTQTWKLHSGSWTQLSPPTTPGPLVNGSVAWDNHNDYLTLFGGYSPTGGLQNKTWAWNASAVTFVQIPTYDSPPPLANLSAVFDVSVKEIAVFGGSALYGPTYGTWYLGRNFSASLKITPHQNITLGSYLNYSVLPVGGLPPYSYSYVGLPPGCSSANQPYINCTPDPVYGGRFISHAFVSDSLGQEYETNGVTVNITAPNHLNVTVACYPSCNESYGENVYINTNVTGEPLYYTFHYLELPPGCTPNDAYVIGCAPTTLGRFPVEVNVSDDYFHWRYGYGNVTVGIPAPTGLHATGETATSISLAWVNPTIAGLVNDTVWYGTSCSSLTPVSTQGLVSSYTLSGLLPDTTYCIAVQVWNATGGSPLSSTISASTLPTVPPAPTDLQATGETATSISLAWTNPTTGGLLNDTVWYGTSCSSLTPVSTDGVASTATLSGLLPDTTYCIAVQAWNATGGSPLSSTIEVSTLPTSMPGEVPSPPTGLRATGKTTTTLSLAWVNPTTGGLLNNTVWFGTSCSSLTSVSTDGVTSTYSLAALRSNTTYCIAVQVWNATGGSRLSSTINVSTSPTSSTSPPGRVPSAPTGLEAIAVTSVSVLLAWEDPPAITNVTLYVSPAGCTDLVGLSEGASTTQANVTGLSPSTPYCFAVRAWNATGEGPADFTNATTSAAPTVSHGSPTAGPKAVPFLEIVAVSLAVGAAAAILAFGWQRRRRGAS